MKHIAKNPSLRYLSRTAEQAARADAAFQRAVARQQAKDEAAAAAACAARVCGHSEHAK